MKKSIVFVGVAILLNACTAIEFSPRTDQPSSTIRDLLIDTENTVKKEEEEKFVLNNETVSQVLKELKKDIHSQEKIIVDQKAKKIELSVGKYIKIKDDAGVQNMKLVLSPRRASWDLKQEGNSILFRSIYQGTYLITWENFLGVPKQLRVENLLKYKFTERENYAIIARNFETKNLKSLQEAVSLYQIAFSEGTHLRRAMFFLLQLSVEQKNKTIVKESLKYWKRLEGLSPEEEEQISLAEELLGMKKTIEIEEEKDHTFIDRNQYDNFKSLYQAGNRKATLNLYDAAIADYLEALEMNENYEETAQVYNGLGNAYFGLEKYTESLEYFEKALKVMSSSEKKEKGAELYYKIASAYKKNGNHSQYVKILKIVKATYPNTLWGRKAQIELMK